MCSDTDSVVVTWATASEAFACSAGMGITNPIRQGTYVLDITLFNGGMNPVSTVTPALTEDILAGAVTQVPPIIFGVAQVHFSWSITMNGSPATCAATDEVHVVFNGNGLTNAEFSFPCMSQGVMEGVIPILTGDYSVTARLQMTGSTTIEASTPSFSVHSPGNATPIVFAL
jgi:hypothetical protein